MLLRKITGKISHPHLLYSHHSNRDILEDNKNLRGHSLLQSDDQKLNQVSQEILEENLPNRVNECFAFPFESIANVYL